MVTEMTDKQMQVILNLVADKFNSCKDMEEVKKAIEEVREMARKDKASEQVLENSAKGGELAIATPNCNHIINYLARERKQKMSETKFDQIKYQNEYNKNKYDKILLCIPKGQKDIIKEKAKLEGKSVNEFIYSAVKKELLQLSIGD